MDHLIANQLKSKMNQLEPTFLSLENESHMHNVPANSETHFKAVIVSEIFQDMALVKRHQKVYAVLGSMMQAIHALALHTYTPDEWQVKNQTALESPSCLGGSKK